MVAPLFSRCLGAGRGQKREGVATLSVACVPGAGIWRVAPQGGVKDNTNNVQTSAWNRDRADRISGYLNFPTLHGEAGWGSNCIGRGWAVGVSGSPRAAVGPRPVVKDLGLGGWGCAPGVWALIVRGSYRGRAVGRCRCARCGCPCLGGWVWAVCGGGFDGGAPLARVIRGARGGWRCLRGWQVDCGVVVRRPRGRGVGALRAGSWSLVGLGVGVATAGPVAVGKIHGAPKTQIWEVEILLFQIFLKSLRISENL